MSIYVKMKDRFLGQWREDIDGKNSVFVVECDTQEQANQVVRVASDQNEMSGIKQVIHCPKSSERSHVSVKHFNDCGLYHAKGI